MYPRSGRVPLELCKPIRGAPVALSGQWRPLALPCGRWAAGRRRRAPETIPVGSPGTIPLRARLLAAPVRPARPKMAVAATRRSEVEVRVPGVLPRARAEGREWVEAQAAPEQRAP